MSRRAGELQALVEIGEQVRVAEVAEELSPVELGQGLEKIGGMHERQFPTRLPGLLERARVLAAALLHVETSNLARSSGGARTRLLRSDRAFPVAAASREGNLPESLSTGHLLGHLLGVCPRPNLP
jgi:hypothetical protein